MVFDETNPDDCWRQLYYDKKTGLILHSGCYLRTSPYSVCFYYEGSEPDEYNRVMAIICEKLKLALDKSSNDQSYFYELYTPENVISLAKALDEVVDFDILQRLNYLEKYERNISEAESSSLPSIALSNILSPFSKVFKNFSSSALIILAMNSSLFSRYG